MQDYLGCDFIIKLSIINSSDNICWILGAPIHLVFFAQIKILLVI
jgi:hypothetical protein